MKLRELWQALEAAKVPHRADEHDDGPVVPAMIARGLQMILLTGQRPGEVFGMLKAEIDRDAAGGPVWIIRYSARKPATTRTRPITSCR